MLFLFPIVPGKIWFWGIACRAGAIIRDVTRSSSKHRLYGFSIAFFVIRNEVIPLPVLLVGNDTGKHINLEFLILWGMGIIKSPLFERDIFTYKI